jgi:four helix bundle protein
MKNVPPEPRQISSTEIRSHRDLHVWQRSIQLVVETYRLTSRLPETERFGLIHQIRSATVSVASNIAEGHGRLGSGEYLQGLSRARGELKEAPPNQAANEETQSAQK